MYHECDADEGKTFHIGCSFGVLISYQDRDDALMRKAERAGAKIAAYQEWLMHEDERRDQGRLQMLREDRASHIHREYWRYLGDPVEIGGWQIDSDKDFAFSNPLPKDFEYIKKERPSFKDGSGVDNEDELLDIQADVLRQQEQAIKDFEDRKKAAADAKQRREEEARQRKLREESDRRLAETQEKRRQVRIHLAAVKFDRAKQVELVEKKLKEEAEAAESELQKEQERERARSLKLAEEKRLENERCAMAAEELMLIEINNRSREIQLKQHEDILSFMHRRYEQLFEEKRKKRMQDLQDLYEPFEPFTFKEERTESLYSEMANLSDQEEGNARCEENLGERVSTLEIRLNEKFLDLQNQREQQLQLTHEDSGLLHTSNSTLEMKSSLVESEKKINGSLFKFTPNVTKQIQRLNDMGENFDFRNIGNQVKFKKPVLGWIGPNEKLEASLRRELTSKHHAHQVRDKLIDLDRRSLRKFNVDELQPVSIRSANSTRREVGLPKSLLHSMKGLQGSLSNADLLKDRSSSSRITSLHTEPLNDLPSEVFSSSDLDSQEVLVNKNAHTLASLSSMGHKPGKREHNVAQTISTMRLAKNKVHEYMGSDYLLQADYMKNFYDATLETDMGGVKIRKKGFLEENHEVSHFAHELESYASSNPLLAYELDERSNGSDSQLLMDNLSPGVLQSPSLHQFGPDSIESSANELKEHEPFLLPSKSVDAFGNTSRGRGKKKTHKRSKSQAIKKYSQNLSEMSSEGTEQQFTAEGDPYYPPFHHKSLAFFGSKIDICEHDPRLTGKQSNKPMMKAQPELHDKSVESSQIVMTIPALAPISSISYTQAENSTTDLHDEPNRMRLFSFNAQNTSMCGEVHHFFHDDDVSLDSENFKDSPIVVHRKKIISGNKMKYNKNRKEEQIGPGNMVVFDGKPMTPAVPYLPPIPVVSMSSTTTADITQQRKIIRSSNRK